MDNHNDDFLSSALSQTLGGVEEKPAEPIIPPVDPALPPADPALEQPTDPAAITDPANPPAPLDPPADPLPGAHTTETEFLQKHFSDLGIDSVERAKEIIKESTTLATTLKSANEELDRLRATPHFADENDKRVFEWAKQYRTLDERAFIEHKMLDRIDPAQIEGKKAMELDYILSNKTLSHEDAKKRFEYTYNKRFTAGELASDEDIDMIRIEKAEAEAQAKENLANLKQKYGTVQQQQETPEQMAQKMALNRSIESVVSNWDQTVPTRKEFAIKPGAVEYRVEVPEAVRGMLNNIIRPIIADKANYGPDGNLKVNVEWMVQRELKLLLFDDLVSKMETDVTNRAKDEAFKSVTSRQPDPVRPGGEPPKITDTTEGNMANSIMSNIR